MRQVALVGFADNRRFAPFDDPSWEIWTMNQGAGAPTWIEAPRHDMHFEMHRPEVIDAEPGYRDWLRELRVPVWMQEAYADIPCAYRFPLEAFDRRYFNSTADYMLALATYAKVDVVGLWGIHMRAGSAEYQHQKPGLSYWTGVAEGRGIQIVLPDDCALLQHDHLYGYELPPTPEEQAARREAELARAGAETVAAAIMRLEHV